MEADNVVIWIIGAAVALVGAAAVMIRSIAKNPKTENGHQEFRAAIRNDFHRLESVAESLHVKVDDMSNRVTAIETRLALKDK